MLALGEIATFNHAAVTDNHNRVTHSFHFTQDDTGEANTFSRLLQFKAFLLESLLIQRIQSTRWLIRNVKISVLTQSGEHQHFLAVTFTVGTGFFLRIKFRSLAQFIGFYINSPPV